MSPTDYLLLGVLVPVTLYVFATVGIALLRAPSSTEPSDEGDREVDTPNRWRRFRVSPDSLLRGPAGASVAQEEPDGFQLRILGKRGQTFPLRLGDSSGEVILRLDRRLFVFRATLEIHVLGRPWIALRRGARGSPDMTGIQRSAKGEDDEAPLEATDLELQGSLPAREYEVRANGRLVASVSWQCEGDPSPSAHDDAQHYYLEVINSAPVTHIVALVLALEVLHKT